MAIFKNVAKTIGINMISTGGLATTATPVIYYAGGTCGTLSAVTNSPVNNKLPSGTATNMWHLTLTATEMNSESVRVFAKAVGCLEWSQFFYPDATLSPGAITWTHTVTDSITGLPIDNVEVWVSTDVNGTNIVQGSKYTDVNGVVTFYLDAGTYYFWHRKSGYNFNNGDREVVA